MLTYSYAQGGCMAYSLAQAAVAVGKNRSTILRAIRTGRLSAERDEANGSWAIQPAELLRVYPVAETHVDQHGDDQGRSTDATAELRELRTRIADKDALIAAHERALDDLRHLLEEERVERRQATDRLVAAHAQIAALLTDQRPPRRSWWRWR
jgi:hypothetical protein